MNAVKLNPRPLDTPCIVHHGQQPLHVYDIIMIRGDGTYSWIFLRSGKQLFTSHTVKYWIKQFNSNHLIRVHRSFAVHFEHILTVDKDNMNLQVTGGLNALIARSKRKMVKQLCGSL